jgi:hypothetical protein
VATLIAIRISTAATGNIQILNTGDCKTPLLTTGSLPYGKSDASVFLNSGDIFYATS